jgi:hypothetical protein
MKWLLPVLCAVASLSFFVAATTAGGQSGVYIAIGGLLLIVTSISRRWLAGVPVINSP